MFRPSFLRHVATGRALPWLCATALLGCGAEPRAAGMELGELEPVDQRRLREHSLDVAGAMAGSSAGVSGFDRFGRDVRSPSGSAAARNSGTDAPARAGAPAVAGAGAAQPAASGPPITPMLDADKDPAIESDNTAQGAQPFRCDERYVLSAHAAADSSAPFVVPAGSEKTMAYYFATPWNGARQALGFQFAFGNERVVHHWALYASNAPLQTGRVLDQSVITDAVYVLDAQFITGGGPRNEGVSMPADVGLRLPDQSGFMLQVHYLNVSEEAEQDASSITLCVTSTPQPIEAALHAVGKGSFTVDPLTRTEVTSTCEPENLDEPVHMFAITPHMHDTGVRSRVVLNRHDEQTTVLDAPFDVHSQLSYQLPAMGAGSDLLLMPGDTLTTTCTFDNPRATTISSGPAADQEMCLVLVWAWPAGKLQNGLDATPQFAVSADSSCTER